MDPDAIDRDGEIPREVLDGLAALGAFGIKVPREYGGLGLTQTDYCRAALLLGSHCASTTALSPPTRASACPSRSCCSAPTTRNAGTCRAPPAARSRRSR
ncbi:MAG: acyl-CoA dehydrogenase family protein [Kiritimatiellia bacterium]